MVSALDVNSDNGGNSLALAEAQRTNKKRRKCVSAARDSGWKPAEAPIASDLRIIASAFSRTKTPTR
jgi:hypothetical protein